MRDYDNIVWVRNHLAKVEGLISLLEAVPGDCDMMVEFFPERWLQAFLTRQVAGLLYLVMLVLRWDIRRRLQRLGG